MFATDEAIEEAIALSLEKGYTEKAKALKKFTGIGGEKNEGSRYQRTKDRKPIDGTRHDGIVGVKKRTASSLSKRRKVASNKNQH